VDGKETPLVGFQKLYVNRRKVDNAYKADCVECKPTKSLSLGPRGKTTSAFKQHYARFHPKKYREIWTDRPINQPSIFAAANGALKFTNEKFRAYVASFVVEGDHPFTVVEQKWFKLTCELLRPGVHVVNADTTKSEVMKLHSLHMAKVQNYISSVPGRLSLTSDIWSSDFKKDFVGWTVHFIDANWKLHHFTLDFINITDTHSGKTMYDAFQQLERTWKIVTKLQSVTLDNASANETFAQLIVDNPLYDIDSNFRISCFAHVVNLACQSSLRILKHSIVKVRSLVKEITHNTSRMSAYEQECNRLGEDAKKPVLDVVTRWNSTYDMLVFAYKYRRILDIMAHRIHTEKDGKHLSMSSSEWEYISKVCSLLAPFKEVTEFTSADGYSTAGAIIPLYYEMKRVCKQFISTEQFSEETVSIVDTAHEEEFENDLGYDCEKLLHTAASSAYAKLEKYKLKLSPLLYICTILDPRCNITFFLNVTPEDMREYFKAKLVVRQKYDEFYRSFQKRATKDNNIADNKNKGKKLKHVTAAFNPAKRRLVDDESQLDELDLYLKLEPVDEDTDPLKWWSSMETSYPSVARMARDYLAIPGTSVPCERIFSSAKYSIPAHRASLLAETIRVMQCMKSWLKHESGLKLSI
jgi:hypothetical protein